MGVLIGWPFTRCIINPVYLIAMSPYSCCFYGPYSHCLALSWEDVDSDEFRTAPCGRTEQGWAVLESWACHSVIRGPRAIYLTSLGHSTFHSTFVNLHHEFNFPECLEGRCNDKWEARVMEGGPQHVSPSPTDGHTSTFCPCLMCLWVSGNWFLIDMLCLALRDQTPGYLSSIISFFSLWDSFSLAAYYWLYFPVLY